MSIKFTFMWDRYLKPTSSMLIGTSPELELALYTLCYKTRPNEECFVSLGGTKFTIYTGTSVNKGLRTAYFEL